MLLPDDLGSEPLVQISSWTVGMIESCPGNSSVAEHHQCIVYLPCATLPPLLGLRLPDGECADVRADSPTGRDDELGLEYQCLVITRVTHSRAAVRNELLQGRILTLTATLWKGCAQRDGKGQQLPREQQQTVDSRPLVAVSSPAVELRW